MVGDKILEHAKIPDMYLWAYQNVVRCNTLEFSEAAHRVRDLVRTCQVVEDTIKQLHRRCAWVDIHISCKNNRAVYGAKCIEHFLHARNRFFVPYRVGLPVGMVVYNIERLTLGQLHGYELSIADV